MLIKTPADHIDYDNIKNAHQQFFQINAQNEERLDQRILN